MKLSRLYSNKPGIFEAIDFSPGLNVVFGEIRLPESREKDTHNLGKSTLCKVIDFALLLGRDSKFFLFQNLGRFSEFVFFLEIELDDGGFLTIRRSVEEASKISIKRHKRGRQDFSAYEIDRWDHQDVPFERAQDLVDGQLDWRALKPWKFRKGLGYLLRSQEDFGDVFHLRKSAYRHAEWKPFLAHILGFNSALVAEHYEAEERLAETKATTETIKNELGGSIEDISKIEGLLLLKQSELDKKQALLDVFDFRAQDKERTKDLVDTYDQRIADLNASRYSLTQSKKKVAAALADEQILFSPDEAEQLFREAGVLFQGQIKKDFEQLISFNRAITEERKAYLNVERGEIESELKKLNAEINSLGKKRASALEFLCEADVFKKYKRFTDDLVTLRADITSLERQRVQLHRLQELRTQVRALGEVVAALQSDIEQDVEAQNGDQASLFSQIRIFFSEIVEDVIGRKALLSVSPNRDGHLDFRAEILNEAGNPTSADDGFSYKKLLCIAFDLAVIRAHLDVKFPRFVYHDGIFEALDDRKKENLLAVVRRYADLGLQPIITLIDSDLPQRATTEPVFEEGEVALVLHDEGDDGRLFKMSAW